MPATTRRTRAKGLSMELWRDANQSIPNASIADIVWQAGASDGRLGESLWTPAAPTLLTFPTPGMYAVVVHIDWFPNNTGWRYVSVLKTNYDGSISGGARRQQAVQGDVTQMGLATHLKVTTPGQAIKVQVFQTSGGALDVQSAFNGTAFSPGIMVSRLGQPYIQDTY